MSTNSNMTKRLTGARRCSCKNVKSEEIARGATVTVYAVFI